VNRFDVFNGDADGLCALHQWRLAYPAVATLVTGVKRDIRLLSRVQAAAGDAVLALDISLDTNRDDVERLLAAGASLRYFDHHYAGDPIVHPALEATIDTAPDQCTSLLVDKALGGRFRAWAVVAAFGDNLHLAARQAAVPLDLDGEALKSLAELGELLNYNAYGDSVADLHCLPDALYQQLAPYVEPMDFIHEAPTFARLRAGFKEDIANSDAIAPCLDSAKVAAWLLPDAAWSRRVVGVLSNRLAVANPARAHALLVPNNSGNLTVSVRAPQVRPTGADEFCRRYPTGGGRKAAAGINHLPVGGIDTFFADFSGFFQE
jgi:hypothetical protein